jgi:tungstate transport system ATP-binding protein
VNTAADHLFPARLERIGFEAGGRRLLADVTTRIGQAPLTVLLGPNGAGKTLLLRICRGLLRPSRGNVLWGQTGVAHLGVNVGYVPQHPVMLRRSVEANLDYALTLAGVPSRQRPERIRTALATVRLEGFERCNARRLSGGERQRLAIARAWVQRPAALLLDEPAAHLDPAAAASIERVIATVRDAGTRVILCTHDLHQARRLADEVVFMCNGQLVEQAPGEAFFERPQSETAARFIAGELLA